MRIKYSFFLVLIILFVNKNSFAQTHYENLKEADRQRALTNERNRESDRQNAHNNRPFETNTSNSTIPNTSTSNSSWGLTGRYEREQREREASDAKNKALLKAYDEKIAAIDNCYKTYPKTKENYDKIFNCAISGGVDWYTASRIIGFSADDLQSKIDLLNQSNNLKNSQFEAKLPEAKPLVQKNTFTGTIVNGKKLGKGIYIDSWGWIREGEFVDDLINGYGTEKGPYGGIYEGYFEKGVKNGKGKISYSNGGYCEGNYENGALNGYMVCINKRGDKYEGNSVNDLQDGKGKSSYADGSVFEGSFKKSYKSGYGVYRYNNGVVYEGDFILDKYDGIGKLIKKSGYYEIGIFKNNLPVKVKYYNPLNEKISKSEYDKN